VDADLRSLERAAAGGDVDAEARLLQARLRRGDLDPTRLRLAAHLGHPAAVKALGPEAPPPPGDDWVRALEDWGEEVCLRAALAVVRQLVSERLQEVRDNLTTAMTPALPTQIVRSWLLQTIATRRLATVPAVFGQLIAQLLDISCLFSHRRI